MTVGLTKPIKIFYCYARKDKKLRDELENHLEFLRRSDQIISWYDREILPGTEWKHEIDIHLNSADIVLLLISSNFMRSDYCYGVEMRRALERHRAGEARVIPIILRPVAWEGTPLSELQALPTDGKPVTRWRSHDDAFLEVAKGIQEVVKKQAASQLAEQQWLRVGRANNLIPNELELLVTIGRMLSTTQEIDKVLQLALEEVIHLVNAECGYLVLTDPVTKKLEFTFAIDKDGQPIDRSAYRISYGTINRVLRTQEPILSDDAKLDDALKGEEFIMTYGLRSIMCAPLVVRNLCIGAVYVDSRIYKNLFHPKHRDILLAFCNLMAYAIDNARVIEQLAQQKQ